METKRIVELCGAAIAVLGLGAGNVIQQSEVNTQDEAIERWEQQVNACFKRSDERELRLRDECLGWISRFTNNSNATVAYSPVTHNNCVSNLKCPSWPCEHDDQCLGCECHDGYCE